MAPIEIFFNLFVVLAFFASATDHYLYGRGERCVPVRAFLLGCFIFTEGYLAINNPVVWLYVSLSVWGLLNLFFGKRFAPNGVKR